MMLHNKQKVKSNVDNIKINNEIVGLTDDEVLERVKRGEVNRLPKAPSRTLMQILRANFINIFNGINLVLGLLVIIAGSPKNALFAFVIIINSFIGVYQEISAKRTLEKLSVLSMASAKVLRNGNVIEIPIEEIVIDDIIYLSTGQQVLADCELVNSNELEIDESMLTGEADPIYKAEGSNLLSGSFVVAGEGYARVVEVGKETYTSKLAEEAKKFKIVNSELQLAISKIIKFLLWLIIPVAAMLIVSQMVFVKSDWRTALIGVVSGIVGMIPEGLVLLTSATFIVSVVKLAKYDTLVQQLSATEILARVDVLCLDKTGTITEGKLELVKVLELGKHDKKEIDDILSALVHTLPSGNPTQQAILEAYEKKSDLVVTNMLPFSSKRKYGGVVIKDKGTWLMGAPEILLQDRYKEIKHDVERYAKEGKRVLLLGKSSQNDLRDDLDDSVESVALILLEDVIRENAKEVLDYFEDEGVNVKVISGDNAVTVSAVAKRAGVNNAEIYIDARELPSSLDELEKVIDNYTVFGRVTPHQKKNIVSALQKKNHVVAMTGDGVNDVLALKESDCGIAMANGTDATKAVSQLVLMNSDFTSLPKVLGEGRKQINNLERVAELFLSKTMFFILVAFIFSVMRQGYPIDAIQSSLVGSCAIGIPAFFLALMPFKGRVKGKFLQRVLSKSIPNGIIMVAMVSIAYMITLNNTNNISLSKTVSVLTFAAISIIVLIKVSSPFNSIKFGIVVSMALVMLLAFITKIGRIIFSFQHVGMKEILFVVILTAVTVPLMAIGHTIANKIVKVE